VIRSGPVPVSQTSPIRTQLQDIPVEGRAGLPPRADAVYGAGAEGDGRQTRRGGQGLLGGAVHHVQSPAVGEEGRPADGGHGVHDEEGVVAVAEVAEAVQGLEDAGRCVAVHQEHGARLVLLQGDPDGVEAQRLAFHAVDQLNLAA